MSTEGEDERLARWERWALEDAAKHRRRMRAWKHAREYVSMKRLLVNGLVAGEVHLRATSTGGKTWQEPGQDTDYRIVTDPATDPVRCPVCADRPENRTAQLPDHPQWSHDRAGGSNWWSKPTVTRRWCERHQA